MIDKTKAIQGISAIITIILSSISCYKVFEEGSFDSTGYLSLAFNFMLFTIMAQSFNNGKNSS
jgi:hypothetical protein